VTSAGEIEEKENTIQPPFLCFSHLQNLYLQHLYYPVNFLIAIQN